MGTFRNHNLLIVRAQVTVHSGPENLKKSRQKNSWNEIYQKNFREIAFLAVLNFSQFKKRFLTIFEIAKNGFGQKKIRENNFIYILT